MKHMVGQEVWVNGQPLKVLSVQAGPMMLVGTIAHKTWKLRVKPDGKPAYWLPPMLAKEDA